MPGSLRSKAAAFREASPSQPGGGSRNGSCGTLLETHLRYGDTTGVNPKQYLHVPLAVARCWGRRSELSIAISHRSAKTDLISTMEITMAEIRGLDEAVEALRPHWQEFSEHFESENEKFKEFLRSDHTNMGRIMRCHLISENYIEEYLRKKLDIANISDARLSYYQKAMLLPDRGFPPMLVKPGLLKLHQIRNRFAHNLHSSVSAHELESMTGIMQISGRETKDIEAVELVESFTTLACTFLIVAPAHIEDAFVRATAHLDFGAKINE